MPDLSREDREQISRAVAEVLAEADVVPKAVLDAAEQRIAELLREAQLEWERAQKAEADAERLRATLPVGEEIIRRWEDAKADAERLAEALRRIAEPTQINKREQIRKAGIAREALRLYEQEGKP